MLLRFCHIRTRCFGYHHSINYAWWNHAATRNHPCSYRSTVCRALCEQGRCQSPWPASAAASDPTVPEDAPHPCVCMACWPPAAPTAGCSPSILWRGQQMHRVSTRIGMMLALPHTQHQPLLALRHVPKWMHINTKLSLCLLDIYNHLTQCKRGKTWSLPGWKDGIEDFFCLLLRGIRCRGLGFRWRRNWTCDGLLLGTNFQWTSLTSE